MELKPCPFCGVGRSVVSLWFDDVAKRWRVGCGRCGCSTGIHPRDKTETPAIEAWNTRAPLALSDGAKLFNRLLADLGDVPCKYPCLRDDLYDWLDKQPDGSQWLKQREGKRCT